MDYYSRYFEVDVVKSTSAEAVIPMIEAQFRRHGVPTSLRTDNGPPFNSEGFVKFLHDGGAQQLRTTPLWPTANGEVERQNRSLMKVIRAAYAERKTWKREVQRFLMAYRSTPHSTMVVAPAELLFGRKVHCKLPALGEPATIEAVRDRDSEHKQSMCDSADNANNATSQSTQIGDFREKEECDVAGLLVNTIIIVVLYYYSILYDIYLCICFVPFLCALCSWFLVFSFGLC